MAFNTNRSRVPLTRSFDLPANVEFLVVSWGALTQVPVGDYRGSTKPLDVRAAADIILA